MAGVDFDIRITESAQAVPMPRPARALRVMSYNVRRLRDDVGAVAAVINDVAPDVVLFQEMPRWWRWRTQAADLCAATGLVRASGGGGRAVGTMVAVRLAVNTYESGVVRLPWTYGEQPRAASWVRCEYDGTEFVSTSVHLGLKGFERQRHTSDLLRALPAGRHIIGGDLNEKHNGPVWNRFQRDLLIAGGTDRRPTFSVANPRRRIDAIFIDPHIAVAAYEVVHHDLVAKASDHFPIYTDLTL